MSEDVMVFKIPAGASGEEIIISVTRNGQFGHGVHVNVEGAMMVSATLPVSTEYAGPVFTNEAMDKPTEKITALIAVIDSGERMQIQVGEGDVQSVMKRKDLLPGVEVVAMPDELILYLQAFAKRNQLSEISVCLGTIDLEREQIQKSA